MKTKAILLGLTLALIPGLNRAENGIKMVVGTYTDAGSKGLYSFSFDDSNGSAKELSSLKVDILLISPLARMGVLFML